MPADRVMPTAEAADLIELVRELCTKELAPRVAQDEATERFPRDVFRLLGGVGLLGLPYPEEYGGGGQPYEVYLQVVEEIASVWSSVAEPTSRSGPGCRTCWVASCSAPTACPRLTQALTLRR